MKKIERAGATTKSSRHRPPNLPVAICLILLQLTGCAIQQGPDAMRASWLGYNEAVQNSEQRELLLNLVRLRYTDAPEFLGISSISTQMSFQAGASIGGDFGNVENSNSAFVSPAIFVGYSETPTITFTPLRNREFTRQLVAPVELDSLYLLTQYGYRLRYQEELAESFFTVDRSHFVLAVGERAWDNPDFANLTRLLGLPPRQATYEIDPGPIDMEELNGHLSVATRSVLGTMAYLTNTVSVPESHQRHGLAGSDDNVGAMLSDILEIRVSATPVENAYLSVHYRDFWYYIGGNDIASRRTLGLLTSLMRLAIGAGGAQNVPVLTLPVSP